MIETAADDTGLTSGRRMLILGICCMSLLIVGLDSTIVNIALPSIQRDLHTSVAGLQWVVDAYTLVLASFLLLSGSIADRVGRRRIFQTGLVAFTLGSLLCSLAPSLGWLVAFRMLQAVGGTMVNPVAMGVITNTLVDPRPRARCYDPVGQVLGIVTLASLTYGIIEGPASGWTSPKILGCFVVTAAALVALIRYEPRRADPLIDLRFFRSAPFSGATVIAVCAFAALGGLLLLSTLYLQNVRGYSALHAGLFILPIAALTMIGAPASGRIVAARGPRLPLAVAGVAIIASGLMLTRLTATTSVGWLIGAFVLFGIGFGAVNAPITNTAVSGMPREQAGVAAAIASTSRQVGLSLGVAVIGSAA